MCNPVSANLSSSWGYSASFLFSSGFKCHAGYLIVMFSSSRQERQLGRPIRNQKPSTTALDARADYNHTLSGPKLEATVSDYIKRWGNPG